MEYWLFLPQNRMTVERIVAVARLAEESGYAGLALIDHLVTPLAEHQTLHEAMTLATWVAAHTSTLRIGHLVLCDAFREPAVLAKQAVTLDHASGGRFELGLGWGSWPRELTGFGVTDAPPKQRAARLVESVRTIRGIWAGEGAGPDALVQQPQPLGRIPLVVGGVGPTALRLAREHADWWNVMAANVERIPELRGSVGGARVSAQVMVALDRPDEAAGAARELAARRFPGFGAGLVGGPTGVVRDALAALDVERVYVWLAPPPDDWSVVTFAEGVIHGR